MVTQPSDGTALMWSHYLDSNQKNLTAKGKRLGIRREYRIGYCSFEKKIIEILIPRAGKDRGKPPKVGQPPPSRVARGPPPRDLDPFGRASLPTPYAVGVSGRRRRADRTSSP